MIGHDWSKAVSLGPMRAHFVLVAAFLFATAPAAQAKGPQLNDALHTLSTPSLHYRPGDTLQLFYEVYQAAMPLSVSYQVQGREADGRWVDLGGPAQAQQRHQSQAWALPTSERWPLGEYRVRVDVADAEGKLISTDVPFELAETATVQSATPDND